MTRFEFAKSAIGEVKAIPSKMDDYILKADYHVEKDPCGNGYNVYEKNSGGGGPGPNGGGDCCGSICACMLCFSCPAILTWTYESLIPCICNCLSSDWPPC